MYLLTSPFLLTVEKFDTYAEAAARRLVIGTPAWKIYLAYETEET